MMTHELFITEYIEFKIDSGSWCIPEPYKTGWIVPLGWEEELDKRNISYTIIDYTPLQNDLD
jgi:hypothetical protein